MYYCGRIQARDVPLTPMRFKNADNFIMPFSTLFRKHADCSDGVLAVWKYHISYNFPSLQEHLI